MISYYELLGMIKEDKAPRKIKVHLTNTPRIYKKDDDTEEYCYYVLEDEKEENENYKYYLMESYMESMIFDETIEIIEETKDKKIHWKEKESLNGDFNQKETITILARRTEKLKKAFNEIIEYMEEN